MDEFIEMFGSDHFNRDKICQKCQGEVKLTEQVRRIIYRKFWPDRYRVINRYECKVCGFKQSLEWDI